MVKQNEDHSIAEEISSIAEEGLEKIAKTDTNLKPEIKDHAKSERILELLYFIAEQPDIKRKDYIDHVRAKYNVSNRTAGRYWSIMNYRGQQCQTMLLLIDQQFIKADRENRREVCADMLRLKYEVLLHLQ
jgi:hypothetical protein